MLSTSALFSCSFEARGGLQSRQFDFRYLSFSKITRRSHLCDLLLHSLQLGWALLSQRLGLLHLVQLLAVLDADAQVEGQAHQSAEQLDR